MNRTKTPWGSQPQGGVQLDTPSPGFAFLASTGALYPSGQANYLGALPTRRGMMTSSKMSNHIVLSGSRLRYDPNANGAPLTFVWVVYRDPDAGFPQDPYHAVDLYSSVGYGVTLSLTDLDVNTASFGVLGFWSGGGPGKNLFIPRREVVTIVATLVRTGSNSFSLSGIANGESFSLTGGLDPQPVSLTQLKIDKGTLGLVVMQQASTHDQLRSYYNNPWQFFKAHQRPIFVGLTGSGGGGTIYSVGAFESSVPLDQLSHSLLTTASRTEATVAGSEQALEGAAQFVDSSAAGAANSVQAPALSIPTSQADANLASAIHAATCVVEVVDAAILLVGANQASTLTTMASDAEAAAASEAQALITGMSADTTQATPATDVQAASYVGVGSLTDSAPATDSAATTAVFSVQDSVTLTAQDAPTANTVFPVAKVEVGSTNDASDWSVDNLHNAAATEVASPATAHASTLTQPVSKTELAALTEVASSSQVSTSTTSAPAPASAAQTIDSAIPVAEHESATAGETSSKWLAASVEHQAILTATEAESVVMTAGVQTLETTLVQDVPSAAASWVVTRTELSVAADSSLAGFNLIASLVATGAADAAQVGQIVVAPSVVNEVVTAGESLSTQLTYAASAAENAFALDIAGSTAIFVIGHTEQGVGQETLDGAGAQFTDVSEVATALEALLANLFGPSTISPEMTRVLLEVATTCVELRASRVDVLLQELRTQVSLPELRTVGFAGKR